MKNNISEFSVIMIADTATAERIKQLCAKLPTEPVREDPPHVTLQNRIIHDGKISDEQLLADVRENMKNVQLPIKVSFLKIYPYTSEKYGESCGISVTKNDLLKPKQQLVAGLQTLGYRLHSEFADTAKYTAHITIGLGSAFTNEVKARAEAAFSNHPGISLVSWAILRFYEQGGKRLVKIIQP